MNLSFATHMVKACREMGYETDLLCGEENTAKEVACAVLVRG